MARIALLTNLPAPYRLPLFKALAQHPGTTLRVFFCPDRGELSQRKWGFDKLEFDYEIISSWIPSFHHRFFWFNPFLLKHLIRFRPQVIIAWSSFAGILAGLYCWISGIPLVLWSGGTQLTEVGIDPFRSIIRRFLFGRTRHFLAYSEEASQYIQSWGVQVDKISVIGNVTLDPFEYHHRVEMYRIQGQKMRQTKGWSQKIILAVGKLIEQKNYIVLLKSYALLKEKMSDVTLLLVGDGILRQQLVRYCEVNGLRDVFFIGAVPPEEMPLYYAIATVFVHPSLRERWPQVVNEAMSAGLPVLVSSSSALPVGLVENDINGYLIDPNDWVVLAAKLEYILSSNMLFENMAAQSFKKICDYGSYKVVRIFTTAVDQLTNYDDGDSKVC